MGVYTSGGQERVFRSSDRGYVSGTNRRSSGQQRRGYVSGSFLLAKGEVPLLKTLLDATDSCYFANIESTRMTTLQTMLSEPDIFRHVFVSDSKCSVEMRRIMGDDEGHKIHGVVDVTTDGHEFSGVNFDDDPE